MNMKYSELNLRAPEVENRTIKLNSGVDLEVRTYLPIDAKADLITWVINLALDDHTGCISPVRFEVCFTIAVVKWYTNLEIDEDIPLSEIYDMFELNDIINQVMGAIPVDELDFLKDLARDTAEDLVRYNNSFAGMISVMNNDANNLDTELNKILDSIKNKEGLE
jgi:hypothetical protein